jgi:peptidoglycan/LPS O-acetylase OafA/YrhL
MAAIAATALIVACWFYSGWTIVFPLAGTYLVFWFAWTPWVRLHGFGKFGDFSYGTYLYAFPIEQMLMRWAGHSVAPWRLFAWATPLTLLVAVGSWYGVERHWLSPVRRKDTAVHAVAG